MEKKMPETPIMHSFKEAKTKKESLPMKNTVIVLIIIGLLGVGTGYVVSKITSGTSQSGAPIMAGTSVKGKTFGSGNAAVFKDTAEGKLVDGGINGEGQYHLVRPGGDSQNVYLTSSLVDLSQFLGKKIKVWGQTQAAQSAGWLMDVGKVEVE